MLRMSSGLFQEGKKAAHITGEKIAQQVICVYKRERDTLSHTSQGLKELSCCQEFPTWKLCQVHRSSILKDPIQLFYLHLNCKETDLNFLLDSLIFRDASQLICKRSLFWEGLWFALCAHFTYPAKHLSLNKHLFLWGPSWLKNQAMTGRKTLCTFLSLQLKAWSKNNLATLSFLWDT